MLEESDDDQVEKDKQRKDKLKKEEEQMQQAIDEANKNSIALEPGVDTDNLTEKTEKKYIFKVFTNYRTHRLKYYMQEYKEVIKVIKKQTQKMSNSYYIEEHFEKCRK